MPLVSRARLSRWFLLLIAVPWCCIAPPVRALVAEEIALLVNSNEPAGRELAMFYAQARQVPENRILELDLPRTEEMSFKQFEEQVVPQVREFLRSGRLEQQVKCLVTFYGVPIRIAGRAPSPHDGQEQGQLRKALLAAVEKVTAPVQSMERMAREMDPAFVPGTGNDFDRLVLRFEAALKAINAQLGTMTDATRRAQAVARLFAAIEPLAGRSAEIRRLAVEAMLQPASQPTTQVGALDAMTRDYQRALEAAARLVQRRFDFQARDELRSLVLKNFGLFGWVKLLREQTDYLETKDTMAAFDSELAMSRWTVYTHVRWRDNPLHYAVDRRQPSPSTLMVMRLDAPKPEQVRRIILDSLRAERDGLQGKLVLDSRGLTVAKQKPAERGLGEYDESIRRLGTLVRAHTSMAVQADDAPEVLPANSAQDVALYCGWYSVRQYVPACKFNPGAVGFHIASYEMISLHEPGEPGWVAGMLNGGAAATLGPVAEPYVQLFPKPDEFFPLLLTGRLTLAEVYWLTTPAASWMLSAIGDPLYTPYKKNPPLAVSDLPDRLKAVLAPPATQP